MQGSGLQDPKWVLCLSGQQFRAACSPYPFSCEEAGALLSVFPWQLLLQLLFSAADVAVGLLGQQCCARSDVFCIRDFLVVAAAAEVGPEQLASSCQTSSLGILLLDSRE